MRKTYAGKLYYFHFKIQLHKFSIKTDYQNKPKLVNKSHRNISMPKLGCKSRNTFFSIQAAFTKFKVSLRICSNYYCECSGKKSDGVYY